MDHKVEVLDQLGQWMIARTDPRIEGAIHRARFENPWFTLHNSSEALSTVAATYLQPTAIRNFVQDYRCPAPNAKRIGIIAAGNIPMVGFHDVLCTYLMGHQALIKLSAKDDSLMRLLLERISEIDSSLEGLQIVQKLENYDAVIATGSNASAALFEKYFAHKPHIIRHNRNAVAVLNGEETAAEIEALGRDIFQYFGLGCRSVSKIYVPRGYDFEILLNGLASFKTVLTNPKYKNNYDYNYATLVINRIPYLTNDFLLLKEDDALASRIATLHYATYGDESDLLQDLGEHKDKIQCVVGRPNLPGWQMVPLGAAQRPALSDFADGVDTMKFLSSL